MKTLFKIFYKLNEFIKKGYNKTILAPGLKASFGSCGKNVRISYDCDIKPPHNVYIGDNSQIGPHSLFWTTRAKIVIKDYVLIGPNVTIITGDHRVDIIGKHIQEVTDEEKLPKHDADVEIKDGVWIGSNVTILKGVIIGEGSVVAAGSVVTKSLAPYGIYGGVPARKIQDRFSIDNVEEHRKKLNRKVW